jgi:eukaryotic-like serine/threonine-protein kinase
MQADYFKQLQLVFDAALEQSAEIRAEFVSQACGEDHVMAEEVMSLIEYEAKSSASNTAKPFALAVAAFDAAEAKSMIGKTVGHFRLEAEIASGGMGRVFKAKRVDENLDQTVALKLIRQELFNPALLKRFSSERQILASLNHPGIAYFIDAGTDDQGTPFVALEYVDGLPLLEYCARNTLTIRDRVRLFRQILAAVSYAHRNLVVHRDLKPNNVLVTTEGQVKLLDFGIAKVLHVDREQTATVEQFYTFAYAAPEQLLRQHITVACDVYALGAILYTLLAGVPPFEISAQSAGEIERSVLKIPPAPMPSAAMKRGQRALHEQGVSNPRRWAGQLSGDLNNIAQKALRKEPDARYLSVEQFDEDLARYLERRPVLAADAGRLYRVRKFCERNAMAVSLSLLVFSLGASGVGYILVQNDRIRQERDRAQAMSSILKNAFEGANPKSRGMKDYSQTRAMLLAADKQVRAFESKQPRLFSNLAYQIGEIQINIGMYEEGIALIRRAKRVDAVDDDAGVLAVLHALNMQSKEKEARALFDQYRDAINDKRRLSVEEAHLLYVEDRIQESIQTASELLGDPAMLGRPSLREDVQNTLIHAYQASGNLKKALGIADSQIHDRRMRLGEAHGLTLNARLHRVDMLVEMGDVAAAEKELIAMKPWVEKNGDRTSGVSGAYHTYYGTLLANSDRGREAIEHFRSALVDTQISKGNDSRDTYAANFNLAVIIANASDRRSDAYPYFDHALSGIEKKQGQSSSAAGVVRLENARAYLLDQKFDAARRLLTPPHAPEYFKKMTQSQRDLYREVLEEAFGNISCGHVSKNLSVDRLAQREVAAAMMCSDVEKSRK